MTLTETPSSEDDVDEEPELPPGLQERLKRQIDQIYMEGDSCRQWSVLSPRLGPGNRVRIVSPASPPSRDGIARGIDLPTSRGLQVELDDYVFADGVTWPAVVKIEPPDLNAAFADPECAQSSRPRAGKAPTCSGRARHGSRTTRPRPLVGFSDVTHINAPTSAVATLTCATASLLPHSRRVVPKASHLNGHAEPTRDFLRAEAPGRRPDQQRTGKQQGTAQCRRLFLFVRTTCTERDTVEVTHHRKFALKQYM